MMQEAKVLSSARHHYVVEVFHTYFQDGDPNQLKLAVIMARADTNLQNYFGREHTPILNGLAV